MKGKIAIIIESNSMDNKQLTTTAKQELDRMMHANNVQVQIVPMHLEHVKDKRKSMRLWFT